MLDINGVSKTLHLLRADRIDQNKKQKSLLNTDSSNSNIFEDTGYLSI